MMKKNYLISAVVDHETGQFKGFIYGVSCSDLQAIAIKLKLQLYGKVLICKINNEGTEVITLKE